MSVLLIGWVVQCVADWLGGSVQFEQFEQFIESRKHRTQIMGMRDIVQLYTMVQQIMYA